MGSVKKIKDVFVLSVVRTPLGSFQKSLSLFSLTELGGIAIKAAVEKTGINFNQVENCYIWLVFL